MKLRTLTSLVMALSLGACAMHGDHHPPRGMPGGKDLDPRNPQVQVDKGRVSVNQEVLRFAKGETNVLITWRLPEGGPWRFADRGIVFEKQAEGEIVRCQVGKRPTEFSCLNLHSRRDHFKYDVYVLEGDKPLKPLDPFVMND